MKMRNHRGFTLLELIIAVTIFSIVAVAIYSSFNVGIRAWRKAENSYKIRQEARYVLDSIGRELRNTVNFTPMPFNGTSTSVSFPRALKISNPKDEYSEGIFKITYTFDAEAKSLNYILQTYQESAKGESGAKSPLSSGVSAVKFEYAYQDGEEEKIAWKGEWTEDNNSIPLGVRVTLSYPSQDEGGVVEFSEAILIPTATLKEATEGT